MSASTTINGNSADCGLDWHVDEDDLITITLTKNETLDIPSDSTFWFYGVDYNQGTENTHIEAFDCSLVSTDVLGMSEQYQIEAEEFELELV